MVENGGPILSVKGLSKSFGRVDALKGIDLVLDSPGVYGFLGPNGAGKTTTFKIISGLLRGDEGKVAICGNDIKTGRKKALRALGMLFDSPAYYPYLTGRENLEVFSRWSGLDAGDRTGELLGEVGLSEAAGRRVGDYSWGMKRRLGIAACLLGDPKLLILDEPTNGLDPAGIADIRMLLPELASRQDRAVLLSSHRMDEVEQICDMVTIIDKGKIVASGETSKLSRPRSQVEIICGDAEGASKVLEKVQGIEGIERKGMDVLLVMSPGLPAAAINSLLVESGIEVRQVMEKRETLEEVFFRLTGDDKDEK